MSIQQHTKTNFFEYVKSWMGVFYQIFQRSANSEKRKIFFSYRTFRTHPVFKSYYDQPPLQWSNFHSADLLHWINYPKFIDNRPFIVESNDHPLSAVGWKKKVWEPIDVVNLLEVAQEVYEHKNCKAILIPCDGFRELFGYYFSDKVCEKLIEVPQVICNKREIDWDARLELPLSFCCLASDYTLKGVDLVISAWLSLRNKQASKLILACPNIPLQIQEIIKGEKSIVMIKKAPLTAAEKDFIFRVTHVSVAPTHIHGGANVAEGLEYGHLPLMFDYHSRLFQGFGSSIHVPYHFYKPDNYGKTWKTFKEFLTQLSADKANGVFDMVSDALSLKLAEMIENPELVLSSAKTCQAQSLVRFSSSARNEKLLNIYRKTVSL